MSKKSVLHELLAVEGDLEGIWKKIIEETKKTFKDKEAHFFGFHRKLEVFDENDKTQYPEEYKEMDTTVKKKLGYVQGHVVRYFDAVLQKERTNQDAKADLIVDGTTLAKDIPATFLLGLETRLKMLRSVYEVIPTLPPGIKWVKDESKGDDVYIVEKPEEKLKTAKTFQHKVLYDATKEHPAQIERWEETVNVGKFIKVHWAGMLTPAEKSAIMGRLDKLIRATKKARQRANTTEIVKLNIGKELFNYINGV